MSSLTGYRKASPSRTAGILAYDHAPGRDQFLRDVIDGLSLPEKSLPCKYFYDEAGSRLFDAICETEEYYPTRTELSIMFEALPAMARRIGPQALLVEYGSGTSLKTRLLLAELQSPAGYVPIDICREHLVEAAAQLSALFPELAVLPVCGDYMSRLQLPETIERPRRKLVYFPGSTIGNFYPAQAHRFLEQAAYLCGRGGAMLIGVDLRKDNDVLNAAYNDGMGVTAAFNLNLLARINNELGADFDLSCFAHDAYYNEFRGRIEMHLVSRRPQRVRLSGHTFSFQDGESILTECSYKYTLTGFESLAAFSGWKIEEVWTDPRMYFAVFFLSVA